MQLSGTSYILSMYGCKIAAVVSIAGSMLKSFFSRRVIFTVNLCLITAFILMAGLEASAIRAGIMVGLALIAKQLGRTYRMKNALMLTAAIMLAFDPLLLLGDLGFQLSVLGLLGIAYLENPIKYWWQYERPGFLSWRDGVVTTLAVLIPMVPSIANNDGTFPLTAIASNVFCYADNRAFRVSARSGKFCIVLRRSFPCQNRRSSFVVPIGCHKTFLDHRHSASDHIQICHRSTFIFLAHRYFRLLLL